MFFYIFYIAQETESIIYLQQFFLTMHVINKCSIFSDSWIAQFLLMLLLLVRGIQEKDSIHFKPWSIQKGSKLYPSLHTISSRRWNCVAATSSERSIVLVETTFKRRYNVYWEATVGCRKNLLIKIAPYFFTSYRIHILASIKCFMGVRN